jgi:hypothetical protein
MDNAEYYESEAERLACLAAQATTPAIKRALLEKAEVYRLMAEGQPLTRQQNALIAKHALMLNRRE